MDDVREVESFSEDEARDELGRLQKILTAADNAYCQADAPELTDAAYDALKERYKAIERAFPELKRPDSLSEKVGAPPAEGFAKVRHEVPMLSLAKAYSDQDVVDFAERARRFHLLRRRRAVHLRLLLLRRRAVVGVGGRRPDRGEAGGRDRQDPSDVAEIH